MDNPGHYDEYPELTRADEELDRARKSKDNIMSDTTKDVVLTDEQILAHFEMPGLNLEATLDAHDLGLLLGGVRTLLSASKPAAPQNDPDAVTRLKLLCRKLGLEKAIPNELYSDPDGLFVIFGQMRARIDALLSASAAAPAQSAELNIPDECVASGASCSYAPEGRHGEMQCRYCGKTQPSAVGLDDERAAISAALDVLYKVSPKSDQSDYVWVEIRKAREGLSALQARAASLQPVAQPVEQTEFHICGECDRQFKTGESLQPVEQTEISSLPVEQSALKQSIAELEFLSFTDDRGLSQSESESMSLVARELKRLMTSRENAFDVALDALAKYQRNWDTGLPAEYAQTERIAMECAVEAVREALYEARDTQPVEQTLPIMRKAFRVTETEGDPDPSKQRFHMRFTFRSMEELNAADDQWRAFVAQPADQSSTIPESFKWWFEREWASYQDKSISDGKITSMTWALKGYRSAQPVEQTRALTIEQQVAIEAALSISFDIENERHDGSFLSEDSVQALRALLAAARPASGETE